MMLRRSFFFVLLLALTAAGPARAALSELLPEPERAAALAAGSPDPRAAWRLLARRGFSSDSIEHAVGVLDENG